MTAFVIATGKIKDPDKFAEYGQKAAPTLEPYGGRVLNHGTLNQALAGGAAHDIGALISFPDQKSLTDWYASPDYQAVIPLRDEAADFTVISYDALS